jgi:glycosyltransferase involved in cell wall biosynthesis
MLIGIDASRAFRSLRTGTERYSLEIMRHLLRLPAAAVHEWRLYVDDSSVDEACNAFLQSCAAPVEIRRLHARPMWTHRALAREVVAQAPDLLFVPAHVIPLRFPAQLPPSVVAVHDLGYHYWPEMHTRWQRIHLELSTRWSVSAAARVICVSQATADDVQAIYGVDRQKIAVVHEGVNVMSTVAASNVTSTLIAVRYGLERPYACFIGTIQPRKNLARLLQAYALLLDHHAVAWDLVMAGKPGWYSESLVSLADELGLRRRVHFLGYVPDEDVGTLLADACFFCFPSLYEGFGLPVLEAQDVGVPVLTANNSSLPEVAGDAALLVDPTDVEAIADAMLRLSKDESLRQQLIAAGHENVKRFSWEKAAKETLAVLEAAAGDGKARA